MHNLFYRKCILLLYDTFWAFPLSLLFSANALLYSPPDPLLPRDNNQVRIKDTIRQGKSPHIDIGHCNPVRGKESQEWKNESGKHLLPLLRVPNLLFFDFILMENLSSSPSPSPLSPILLLLFSHCLPSLLLSFYLYFRMDRFTCLCSYIYFYICRLYIFFHT